MSWLIQAGFGVWVPFGHSPDCDLVAERNRTLYRVQVKTATLYRKARWEVAVCTRGGNRSWSGVVKKLESNRFDYLFVVVGDWRCWFIPSAEVGGQTSLLLGGPNEVGAPQGVQRAEMGETGFEPV